MHAGIFDRSMQSLTEMRYACISDRSIQSMTEILHTCIFDWSIQPLTGVRLTDLELFEKRICLHTFFKHYV